MLPVVALVGRANVGKSTLFNALVRSRQALVADMPGVTRDRHYGMCRLLDREFMIIDTGGLGDTHEGLDDPVSSQAFKAVEEADVVVYLADAVDGLLPQDHAAIKRLRQTGKPLLLAVNKTDRVREELVLAEFARLGFAEILMLAAAHNRGIKSLLAQLEPHFPAPDKADGEEEDDTHVRVAFIGRPNAGKSTLINRLLGEDRLVVSTIAGTTRDAIEIATVRDNKPWLLIDTAGVRRRARVNAEVEKISVIKTIQAINRAQVVVLLVDARENLAEQDLTLIGRVVEEGRALVIALNKWDGMDDYARQQCMDALDRRLGFVPWAKRIMISALHGSGLGELMQAVNQAQLAGGRKMTSSELTRTLASAYESNQPALIRGHLPKLRYAHQGGSHPPTIVIHGSRTKYVSPSYRRYLENTFRKRFQLKGTPVRIELRDNENPYADKVNHLSERQKRRRQRLISWRKAKKKY